MATRCSIFPWEIPWTEEPSRLYCPRGPERVRPDSATKQQQQHRCWNKLRAVKSHAQVRAVGKWHHRDPRTLSAEATLLTLTPGTEGKPRPALDPLAAKPSWSYSCTESLLLWWSCSGSRRRYPPKGWLWSSRRAEKEDEILVKTSHFIIPVWHLVWSLSGWLEKIFKHVVSLQSVQFSCSVLSDSWRPHGLQHARPPCPSPTLEVYSSSCPFSWWCHPTTSSSVVPFSSHLQSFPASGSFQMSQLYASGGQSIGVSASASVLPMNIQDWFPLGWTGWISLPSKGLSRVFSDNHSSKASIRRGWDVSREQHVYYL